MTGKPGAKSWNRVIIGLIALAAVAVIGFAVAYFSWVHYERRAVSHIPAGTVLAARVDVEHVVLYEPLRKHLFPVLATAAARSVSSSGESSTDESSLADRIKQHTGISVGMDLRELVFAVGDNGSWTLLIGGLFPGDGVAAGVKALLDESKSDGAGGRQSRCQLSSARLVCSQPQLVFEQASDGVLVVASSLEALEAALRPSTAHASIGLKASGAASLAVTRGALGGALDNPILALAPGVSALRKVERVNAEVTLADHAEVRLTLTPGAGQSVAGLDSAADSILAALQLLSSLNLSGGALAERELLGRAQVEPSGEGAAIRSFYTQQELDLAARAIARRVSIWLGVTPK